MTTKDKLKQYIDQLPDDKLPYVEKMIETILAQRNQLLPKGKLGLKEPFHRGAIYEDILAHRH